MFAMPALLSVYPDALFVQTHRTPVDSMASVSSLVTVLRSAFSHAVDSFTVSREAIHYWSETMKKFLPERDRLAKHRILGDVQYDEIRREPIRVVQRIYEYFGWSLSRETERRMRDSLPARLGDNLPITDTIYRSLVPPLESVRCV